MASPTQGFLGLEEAQIQQAVRRGESNELNKIGNLRASLAELAFTLGAALPDGCPMVIGGGLIRDAIMGGVPGDIDIWLPANIAIPEGGYSNLGGPTNVGSFASWIRTQMNLPALPATVFAMGGGGTFEQTLGAPVVGHEHAYRDVSNHWVVEFNYNGFQINIMRSMVPWTGDSERFFTRLMQNFDMDLAMFFVGMEIPQRSRVFTPPMNVILPSHIVRDLQDETPILKWNWNQERFQVTSSDRLRVRTTKLNSRYDFEDDPGVIPTAMIVATPVEFSFVMEAQYLFPFPQPPEIADLRTTRVAMSQVTRPLNRAARRAPLQRGVYNEFHDEVVVPQNITRQELEARWGRVLPPPPVATPRAGLGFLGDTAEHMVREMERRQLRDQMAREALERNRSTVGTVGQAPVARGTLNSEIQDSPQARRAAYERYFQLNAHNPFQNHFIIGE